MATRRIREYLVGNKVSFGSINHTCAYTAQEVAELSHIPGRHMVKVVVVWLDGELALVAVPSTKVVDLEKLRYETGVLDARLADESDFRDRFSDCQVGTVPPFGNLFGVNTFVDRQLTSGEPLAFSAGTHRDVMVIRYADYARLVKPGIVDVAVDSCHAVPNARTARPQKRSGRTASRTQSAHESLETETATQAQCGCPIMHHAGAD